MTRSLKKSAPQATPANDDPQEPKRIVRKDIALPLATIERFALEAFTVWIIGDTPLIVHAWSEKAKRQMLEKQIGKSKLGKDQRNPEQDFRDALYEMKPGIYGFPAMGIKNSWVESAHKDKNIPKTSARAALWIDGDMTRLRPGRANAICDMPLVRIYSGGPEMREDMVSIGAGFKKVANLAYRPQFTVWACRVSGRYNPHILTSEKLEQLIDESGFQVGIGEWRSEKNGMFGSYHLAEADEVKAWDAFAEGKGDLPISPNFSYLDEAAE